MTDTPHPGLIDVGGTSYLRDAKGALVPLQAIKPQDLLMDEQVRSIMVQARALAAQIRKFKVDTFAAVAVLQALLADHYGASRGGAKGNITLTSFDGCLKVQVQVADLIEFGPELQSAKSLIDECLGEWAQGGSVELQALINRAFQVDKQGQINRAELFMLLRTEIADPRWMRAMEAIKDSIRIIGSRQYVRFYERDAHDAAWRAVSIDIATA